MATGCSVSAPTDPACNWAGNSLFAPTDPVCNAGRWIQLCKADALHINKLLSRAQHDRDRRRDRFMRENPGAEWHSKKQAFAPIWPAAVVDVLNSISYQCQSGVNWVTFDERQYALWFWIGGDLEAEICSLVRSEQKLLEGKREKYRKEHPKVETSLARLMARGL